MNSSDIFFDDIDPGFKELQSLRINRRKQSQHGIIGPWSSPKRKTSPRKKDQPQSLFEIAKKKRSLVPHRSISPASPVGQEKSMMITRRMKTHVIEFIDQQKLSKKQELQGSSKMFTLRAFEVKQINPIKEPHSLKHPVEPSFISLFKYKRHKIKSKQASFDISQYYDKRDKKLMPLIDKNHLESRKGKILSLGFQKVINQRLHFQSYDHQRKHIQLMLKSHLF